MTTSAGSGPEQPADEILELVARCLERIDGAREPPLSVLDELCREHPEHAGALRARLAHLERAGLASGRPPGNGGGTLGRFELQGELGRGGMGVVYLAYDPRLGRLVDLGRLEEAEYRLQETLAAQAGTLGPQHRAVDATLAELERLYPLLGSPVELSVVHGKQELARKLRAAGVPPLSGADDTPLGYARYD